MKDKHNRLVRAKTTAALVNACSVPIDQAVKVALMSIEGFVVDAKLKEKDQTVLWRIKLLTAGGRVKVYVDARSGSILEANREETITGPDGPVIPEGVVAGRMHSFESAPR